MRVCIGLIIRRRVLSPGFLASYWSAGFGRFLQVSAHASHWLDDCANFTPKLEGNNQYSTNTSHETVPLNGDFLETHFAILQNNACKNKSIFPLFFEK
jgi:hypothetical protein